MWITGDIPLTWAGKMRITENRKGRKAVATSPQP